MPFYLITYILNTHKQTTDKGNLSIIKIKSIVTFEKSSISLM